MFNIYKKIADHLRSTLPDLGTIDADKGQLANPESHYPMNFPAVLIDIDNVAWADMGLIIQKGAGTFGVTVAVNPANQSHQDSETIDAFVAEMQIVNDVYGSIAKLGGFTRTKTVRQKRYDELQVFTHIYTTGITDQTAKKKYKAITPNPDPIIRGKTPNSIAVFPEDLG